MKKKYSTKRSLIASLLVLCLCLSSFVGTTFAWFTDSVTSANNIIKSGNLDVELYYQVEGQSDWTKVGKDTNVFKEGALWEPGYTEVVKFKVVNEGSLALKYNLGVNVASEIGSTNVYGEAFKLSDFIEFGVIDGTASYDRASAIAAVGDVATKLNTAYSKSSALEPKAEETVTMVVYMPTSVGNDANYAKDATVPVINLGINLFATQYTFEEDSFGSDYDKGAAWTGESNIDWYLEDPTATTFEIGSAEELAGLAAIVNGTAVAPVTTFAAESTPTIIQDTFKGKTVKLAADVDLRGMAWTPIGRIGTTSTDFTYSFKGVFDGQNHTVSNLDVNAYGWAGVFGLAYGAEINNLKVDGVSIVANRLAGAVVGQLYGSIDNCHVKNAEIMVTPNAVDGGYDNGDKVGGIVGWLGDNNNNRTLTNCSANGVKLGAYRDVGGIAGYVAWSTTISGNSVDKLDITVDQITNFYGAKDPNAGAIWGRNSVSTTGVGVYDSNNTTGAEVYIVSTYSRGGITYKEDGVTDDVMLYLVPADYAESTVNVPEGVTTIGGYAFAHNTNVDKIVLSSTVKKLNDRAFRDTTASTVVLNEGLENISYQAFRNATNVKSVEIPSTVKTISLEAFQLSGITELKIPATVTTLEYGACRDMKELVSVTIDSAANIPIYAFRACTKLETVVLNSPDVTFGDGSSGMIFTTTESGDGSAITVYVRNYAVADRLKAADTAAKDYGGYKIELIADKVGNVDDLASALKNGDNVVLTNDIELTGTLMATKDAVIDLNGNTITAPSKDAMFQSQSNAAPSMTITSSVPGAAINVSGGDTAVLLGYGSTEISNVTINVTGCDNYSPNPFNVYGDLTLGEGTVVNIDYLGSALISNNGKVAINIDGAEINIGKFKTNGTAIITLNQASTLEIKNTNIKIDEFVLSPFGGDSLVSKVDGVTIDNCTFDVTDSNAASCTFVAKDGKYRLVKN